MQIKNTTINLYCPRSGKPVSKESLTDYQGYTVGFCNPRCRDDFRLDSANRPQDRRYFDVLIKEKG